MCERGSVTTRNPKTEIKTFDEVVSGYSLQQAVAEASRCLLCYDAPCIKGCPAEVDIPTFIRRIKAEDILGSITIIRRDNPLPGICARICPQEELCEKHCCNKELTGAISIGSLQRFAADFERERGIKPRRSVKTGRRVAVVGSGPAGLAAATKLIEMGHEVMVFEAKPFPGYLLSYGIPPYRLPREVVLAEINYIKKMGVRIRVNERVEKLDESFREGFDAVFLGIGATESISLNIPGEDLDGVYSGLEFLEGVNKAVVGTQQFLSLSGKRVAVIGGGDVAIDVSRCCLRLGAEKVHIVYRRSIREIPAHKSAVTAAKDEGIRLMFLSAPTKILGDEFGKVVGLECIREELGEPDESGRRKPIPIPNSEFKLDVDVVVEAVGQKVDEKIIEDNSNIEVSNGLIVIDKENGMTSLQGVFAGGDAVNGGMTVVQAIAEGKLAAKHIKEYLDDE